MSRKQRSVILDEEVWRVLKVHCAQNGLNVVSKAGEIIAEWVGENCVTSGA